MGVRWNSGLYDNFEICNSHYDHSEMKVAGSSGGFVHYLSMILQIHYAFEDYVAPGVGARNRLTVWMMTEMLAVEVLLEVAATRERLQSLSIRESFVAEAKDTLGGFAFDLEDFRKIRRRRAGR